ncbi:unnamed protein product [Oppiella nova]|uniref:Origin recognition complex subunit 1 n=1 Tax=Oppiella nova TaxID=334625 RepID=A0A7R9LRW4_9ACAR|nr:unnamed protein product [Oppiella nova]CAG2166371.1 unnamed protein product [Oppiella nova]
MDLPEKLMINRVSSRLGLTRLSFHPYSYKELEAIVESRLSGLSDVFDGDALQLICRKVAAVSGDARRALDLCRLSVQTAQMADESMVSLKSVDAALHEMFNSLKLVRIRDAALQEKLFLRSVVQDFRVSGVEESSFIDVYRHHIEMCHFEGHYPPSTVELERIAYNLHTSRLIILEKSGSHLYKRVRLNVSVDDINFALKIFNDFRSIVIRYETDLNEVAVAYIRPVINGCHSYNGILYSTDSTVKDKITSNTCNLNGTQLRVVVNIDLPYCDLEYKDGKYVLKKSIEMKMIELMAERFNFVYEVVYANQSWGTLQNGVWTGSVGHLYNKDAIETLEDLTKAAKSSEYSIVTVPNSFYYELFIHNSPCCGAYHTIGTNINRSMTEFQLPASTQMGIELISEAIRHNKIVIFIYTSVPLMFGIRTYATVEMYISSETLMMDQMAMALPKGSPLLRSMNKAIEQFTENGLYDNWQTETMNSIPAKVHVEDTKGSPIDLIKDLPLKDIQSIFYICILGLLWFGNELH